jgi:transposase
MSFRELTMTDVRELLRRYQAGQSARQVAREGVADRKTAARYFEAAAGAGVDPQRELDEALIADVAQRVQGRPEPDPSEAWRRLEAERGRIEAWLGAERPLRLVRIHELLARAGVVVGYTTLRRFAHKELGFGRPRSTVRLDDPPPGQEAQVDFGKMGYLVEPDGTRRRLHALIVTLPMSRYQFVYPTLLQTVEAVCEGLDAAWGFLGGVVRHLIPDNATSMIIKPDPQAPGLQPGFAEYAAARGLFVDAARVRHPRDKARVENQVPYVRERWFDGETFLDLEDARRSAERWCREVAGARIHGTTRRVPREVYETEERAHMQPAPTAPFDVPTWTQVKVHPDHHVQVGRALYSAPTAYLGRYVRARADKTTVKLYLAAQCIKVHPRVPPGKRSTDPSDYPVGKADYAMRSVDGVRRRAREQGEHVGRFAERLLDGPLPWTKMRQGYGLLRLCDRYGATRVDALCARALAFDVLDVPRLERMLKAGADRPPPVESAGPAKIFVLPPSRFARPSASFATRSVTSDGGPTDPDGGAA